MYVDAFVVREGSREREALGLLPNAHPLPVRLIFVRSPSPIELTTRRTSTDTPGIIQVSLSTDTHRHPSLTVYGHTGIQVPLTGFLRGELGCLHIGNRWCDTATAVAWYTASRCFSRAKSSGRAALRSWYLTKGGGVCVACECVRVSVSVRERESVSVIPTRKHHTHAAIRTRLQSHLFLSSPRKHHTTLLHAYNSGRFSPLFSFSPPPL